MDLKYIFRDVSGCDKSITTVHSIENEQKARDKDWDEAKSLKEKLQDDEVNAKMNDLLQLQSKMMDLHQQQLTNLQIGKLTSKRNFLISDFWPKNFKS